MFKNGTRSGSLGYAAVLAMSAYMLILLACPVDVRAETDEIQVYDAEINEPGQFNVVLHNNYTPAGRTEPDFPGGVVPNHSLCGVPEWAYGVNNSWEVGVYLPLYSLTDGKRALINGAKIRNLFVIPDAKKRPFFYGVNFELSYNFTHWERTRFSGEIRPIIGRHIGPVDVILNPIIDTSFNGFGNLDFAPAGRIAYNFSEKWAAGLEHYADLGRISGFDPVSEQQHVSFVVMDYNGDPNSVEFGIGHGLTSGSDDLVLKLMLIHKF